MQRLPQLGDDKTISMLECHSVALWFSIIHSRMRTTCEQSGSGMFLLSMHLVEMTVEW